MDRLSSPDDVTQSGSELRSRPQVAMTASPDSARATEHTPRVDPADAWSLAASLAQDALWYWDLRDGDLCLSMRAREILGFASEERCASVSSLLRLVDAEDSAALEAAFASLRAGRVTRVEMECRVMSRGGAIRWMRVRARSRRDPQGQVVLVAGTVSDIDQRKRAELRLRDESRLDALTGLPNRVRLSELLTARIARASRTPGSGFAVLYLDLDHFKMINDSLGHAAGDELLLESASRLSAGLGSENVIARMGGDEFVILLDTVPDTETALDIAALLQALTRPPVHIGGREVYVNASVGVRISAPVETKASDMIRDADIAMYEAKKLGGAQTVVFDKSMRDAMIERLRMQTDLNNGVRHAEFELAYQPIFEAANGRLCAFEALARWNHPTRGWLTAGEFVKEANESGMIVVIGRWVVREACHQLAEWMRAYPRAIPLSVGVNICDRELLDPGFVGTIEQALASTGLPPERLVLEMSEGTMVAQAEAAIPALRRLRRRGVQIQMDNFGLGYSSLNTLRRMPLSAVKIDRSIIAGLGGDETAQTMARTIAGFARGLGLDVVAEGVETPEQMEALRTIGGIRFAQGNYFGRPAEALAARELLSGDRANDPG